MQLYLVQHGEAESKETDPERPLTRDGATAVERTAVRAVDLGVAVAEIWHSDKKRAMQTAEAFASALGAGTRERKTLAPNEEVAPLARKLEGRSENLLIVGHLPHLARLASLLLTGREDLPVVAFQKAGLVRIDRGEDGRWSLRWALPP